MKISFSFSSATTKQEKNEILGELQKLEQEKIYKFPIFTVGTYVFTSDNVEIPSEVKFCNPLYNCDIDFENWTMA